MRFQPLRPRPPAPAAILHQTLACVLAAWTISFAPLQSLAQMDYVDRVVDGDTIVARSLGRARLIGVDTPETVAPAQRQQGAPAQCFGPEASLRLKELLPPGTRVRLEADVSPTDRFGRSLVYVYREPDDVFINGALVEGGFARAKAFKPNVQFSGLFDSLQKDAQNSRRGLWLACASDDTPGARASAKAAVALASAPVAVASAATPAAAKADMTVAPVTAAATTQVAAAAAAAPAAKPAASPVQGGKPANQQTTPANPGDVKNCSDFGTYAEAKAWFDTYFVYYGDVAKLDGNKDGVPCEALPGRKA